MKKLLVSLVVLVALIGAAEGQIPSPTPPPIVPYGGIVLDPNGQPRTGIVGLTFALYEDPTVGAPLWVESHAVVLDAQGRYTVVLGSLSPGGVPLELFTTGAARWLGVQVNSEAELPRVMVASVPYALKSADAETLGGLPASAFLLADSLADSQNGGSRSLLGTSVGDRLRVPPSDVDGASNIPPEGFITNDQVIADDLIVQGSTCIGLDCVNGESFGFDTLRFKENNVRIKFEDTSSTAGFPTNDWQITANDSASGGQDKFSIEDISGAKVPFTIEAGAATNSLYVDSTGRIGLRTSTPVLDIHTNTSNTPAMRLEQNSSGGFTAQTWDVAGNEANFFVRDVTGGSRLPLRIRPGAPTSSIDIAASGNVGIGTASPQYRVQINNSGGHALAQFTNATTGSGAADGVYFGVLDGDPTFRIMNQELATIELFTNGARRMTIDGNGKVGIGIRNPNYLTQLYSADSHALLQFTNVTTGDMATDGSYVGVLLGDPTLRIMNQETADIQFFTGGALRATVTSGGATIPQAGLCVDNDGSCTPPAAGQITARVYNTGASDVAEVYTSTEPLGPGDVVVMAGDAAGGVRLSQQAYEAGLLLVVSTQPGTLLGAPAQERLVEAGVNTEQAARQGRLPLLPGTHPIVLLGRVPVKVTLENGPIAVGDPLTSSSTPGHAMKATAPGPILGVALETFGPGAKTDRIEVFVSPQYSFGRSADVLTQARAHADERARLEGELVATKRALAELRAEVETLRVLVNTSTAAQVAAR